MVRFHTMKPAHLNLIEYMNSSMGVCNGELIVSDSEVLFVTLLLKSYKNSMCMNAIIGVIKYVCRDGSSGGAGSSPPMAARLMEPPL